MRCRILSLAILLIAGVAMPARAEILGDAPVPFSAERIVVVDGHSYRGMLFHIPGRERHEQEIQGIAEVIILDAAAKQGFLLLPDLHSYVPFVFPKLMAELDRRSLDGSPLGQETINGIRTTKYRVERTAADGSRAQGFAWLSAQGVLMRLDGTVTRPGGRATAIRLELANLAMGPQDPALFELPPGLIKLPGRALQTFLGGNPG
jgi:hypothetical protein